MVADVTRSYNVLSIEKCLGNYLQITFRSAQQKALALLKDTTFDGCNPTSSNNVDITDHQH